MAWIQIQFWLWLVVSRPCTLIEIFEYTERWQRTKLTENTRFPWILLQKWYKRTWKTISFPMTLTDWKVVSWPLVCINCPFQWARFIEDHFLQYYVVEIFINFTVCIFDSNCTFSVMFDKKFARTSEKIDKQPLKGSMTFLGSIGGLCVHKSPYVQKSVKYNIVGRGLQTSWMKY